MRPAQEEDWRQERAATSVCSPKAGGHLLGAHFSLLSGASLTIGRHTDPSCPELHPEDRLVCSSAHPTEEDLALGTEAGLSHCPGRGTKGPEAT